MHQALRRGSALGSTLVFLSVLSCGGDSPTDTRGGNENPTVVRVSVSPASATIPVGETVQLSATAFLSDGTSRTASASWSSSDAGVASVNAAGLVSGAGAGAATIEASASGVTANASITVQDTTTPPPVPALLEITPATASIERGTSTSFVAVLTDSAGTVITGETVSWSLGDTTLATLLVATGDTAGVRATAVGTTTVDASAAGLQASATLEVLPRPVTSVVVNPADTTVVTGDTVQFLATVSTADGPVQDRPVVWSTTDTAVATVSASGVVVSGVPGSVLIVAASEGVADSAAVTVEAAPPPPPATVEVIPDSTSIVTGETGVLRAVVRDSAGAVLPDQPIQWTVFNAGVASLGLAEADSVVVTAASVGRTTVTASTGDVFAEAVVRVEPQPVTAVTLTPADTTLVAGDSLDFAVTVSTAQGPVQDRTVLWSSTDPTVLQVSSEGRARALQPGPAGVVAVVEGVADTASVQVDAPPPLTVEPASAVLVQGDSVVLRATVLDSQGNLLTDQGVSWSVDGFGQVELLDFDGIDNVGDSILAIGAVPADGVPVNVTATLDTVSVDVVIDVLPAPVTSVVISPSDTTMTEGDELFLTVTVSTAFGEDPFNEVEWSVSPAQDYALDFFDREASLFGAVPGVAQVIASSGGVADTVTVTVDSIPVASVTINTAQDLTLPFLERDQLDLFVDVSGPLGEELTREVSWTISDPNLAEFSFLNTVGTGATLDTFEPGFITLIAEAGGVADTLNFEIEARTISEIRLLNEVGTVTEFFDVNIGRETEMTIEVVSTGGVLLSRDVSLGDVLAFSNSTPDPGGPEVIDAVVEDNSDRFRRRRRIRGGQAGSADVDFTAGTATSLPANITVLAPDSIRPFAVSAADTLVVNDSVSVATGVAFATVALVANEGDTVTVGAASFDEFGVQGSQSFFWQTSDSTFVELVGEQDIETFQEGFTRGYVGREARFVMRAPFTAGRSVFVRNLGTNGDPVVIVFVPPS